MTRHVCLKSKKSIQGWNYEWEPIKKEDSPFQKLLSENSAKEKMVQKYYLDNKEQFLDVHTIKSQMRLEDANGIRGGAFLHALSSRFTIQFNLAKAFLALAKDLNQGEVDSPFCLSLRMYPEARWIFSDRVKLKMYTAVPLDDVLRNIQRLFQHWRLENYQIKFRTHVASYLTQLPQFKVKVGSNIPPFETAIRTTTSSIDEICQQLAKLNPKAHSA